jgi:hypothetical protein
MIESGKYPVVPGMFVYQETKQVKLIRTNTKSSYDVSAF